MKKLPLLRNAALCASALLPCNYRIDYKIFKTVYISRSSGVEAHTVCFAGGTLIGKGKQPKAKEDAQRDERAMLCKRTGECERANYKQNTSGSY